MIRNETKTLRNQIAWVESNVAWRWQFERLQSELYTIKNILIDAGILIDLKDNNKGTIYLINGDTYTIKEKK